MARPWRNLLRCSRRDNDVEHIAALPCAVSRASTSQVEYSQGQDDASSAFRARPLGTDFVDAYHQLGLYVGKILKGAKPSELPVQQAAKVEFAINRGSASTLGLTVPLPLCRETPPSSSGRNKNSIVQRLLRAARENRPGDAQRRSQQVNRFAETQ